jgi:3-oxoacyl-[acyl-carrier protein] reductase
MTDDEWMRVINTNLSSAFYMSRAVSHDFVRQQSGAIVNIGSVWGRCGASCEVAYSASKAGLIGFTKALAMEVAPSGIRVNAVAPGVIKTDMLSQYSENDLDALRHETPLERLGTSEDVANAVYFLSSDNADFITGEVLNVNGGFII